MLRSSTLEASQDTISGDTATLLAAVAATGAGTAQQMSAMHKVAQVFGTFVGTVHLEGSLDGTNFTTLGNLTAPGKITNIEPWLYIRGNVTAYTSGAITMILGW